MSVGISLFYFNYNNGDYHEPKGSRNDAFIYLPQN